MILATFWNLGELWPCLITVALLIGLAVWRPWR